MGPDRYLDHLMPLLLQALQNSDEVEVCTAAIGTVGDITRVMQGKISKYCDQIITVVLKAMQDPALNRSIKPCMMSAVGDIALALGTDFQRYLQATMKMVYSASKATEMLPNYVEDDDLVEYINELHIGVLESFTGILNGLEGDIDQPGSSTVSVLLQFEVGPGVNAVHGIAEFLQRLSKCVGENNKYAPGNGTAESEVISSSVALIGDIARLLKEQAKPYLPNEITMPLIHECEMIPQDDESNYKNAQENATYAKQKLSEC